VNDFGWIMELAKGLAIVSVGLQFLLGRNNQHGAYIIFGATA